VSRAHFFRLFFLHAGLQDPQIEKHGKTETKTDQDKKHVLKQQTEVQFVVFAYLGPWRLLAVVHSSSGCLLGDLKTMSDRGLSIKPAPFSATNQTKPSPGLNALPEHRTRPWTRTPGPKANRTCPWTPALGSKANRTRPWTRALGSKANRTRPWTRALRSAANRTRRPRPIDSIEPVGPRR
jgi:hypothetical protein